MYPQTHFDWMCLYFKTAANKYPQLFKDTDDSDLLFREDLFLSACEFVDVYLHHPASISCFPSVSAASIFLVAVIETIESLQEGKDNNYICIIILINFIMHSSNRDAKSVHSVQPPSPGVMSAGSEASGCISRHVASSCLRRKGTNGRRQETLAAATSPRPSGYLVLNNRLL